MVGFFKLAEKPGLTPRVGALPIGSMKRRRNLISRRCFIRTATATAAATGLPLWFIERELDEAQAAEEPRSANDKPGIALIGCGGQGRGDAANAQRFGQVVCVCDVDEAHIEQAVKQFTTKDGKRPDRVSDFRRVMDRRDVDVIINGTPDHWHTLINLAACKAKKDIYTEKPLTLTIDEGKRLVKAVRENGVVLQVGSQQRSDRNFRLACELVRNGRIGKLQHIIVGLPTGPREGPFPPKPVPEGLNWDFYVGQAPFMEYNGRNCHWDFRWWYCFSGGQMTDWGAHHNDIAQWGNGTELSGPVEIEGRALVDMIPGGFTAAAEYEVRCKYANGVTMTITDGVRAPNGVKFIGTEGWVFVTRGRLDAHPKALLEEPLPSDAIRLYRSDDHMGNFFQCVRSRNDPICPVEIGHRSITVAHLGVIAVRTGLKLYWDPAKEIFVGDTAAEANLWLERDMRKPYTYAMIA